MGKYKKTVVLDLDGVVHSYKSGWQGAATINDAPVEGIAEVIKELRAEFKVVIVSTRCYQEGGIGAIKEWLNKWNIEVDDVTAEKPPAIVYVDDRAICFSGKTEGLVDKIRGFKNWIEKEKEIKTKLEYDKFIETVKQYEKDYPFSCPMCNENLVLYKEESFSTNHDVWKCSNEGCGYSRRNEK